jgi:pimeloyl-ACP methyl ester carboxylesterase
MGRVILCIGFAAGLTASGSSDNPAGHLVNVGDHRLFVNCTGRPSKLTVIFENGLGSGLETWKPVQSKIQEFSRVCSYDRAGEGRSDKPGQPQTPDTIAADLHGAISPSVAERYATQDGRFDRSDFLRAAGQLEPGKHLEWHLDVPLIVLEHKRLAGAPRTDADRLAVDWHNLQVDLARRSKYGQLIETNSGHFIAGEQPEVVVESVRDVIRQAAQ